MNSNDLCSHLFPYTTLFRSRSPGQAVQGRPSAAGRDAPRGRHTPRRPCRSGPARPAAPGNRSEEHTSELQSRGHLVCRLLLEKKERMKKKVIKLIWSMLKRM